MDLIFIEGFTGQTVIGIHDSELHRPQPVVIDLHAGVPRARACDTDQIGDTIDYGVVAERLRRLLVEHRLQLLEAFADAIADIVIGEFGARWVRVKVVKPRKFDDVQGGGGADRAPRAGTRCRAAAAAWRVGAAADRQRHGARRALSFVDAGTERPRRRPTGLPWSAFFMS